MREPLTIECADRHITRNLPANSSVIFVLAQRLLNDIHIAGLACYTDRHSSIMAAKDSPHLSGEHRPINGPPARLPFSSQRGLVDPRMRASSDHRDHTSYLAIFFPDRALHEHKRLPSLPSHPPSKTAHSCSIKGGLTWSLTAHVERPQLYRGRSVRTRDQPGHPSTHLNRRRAVPYCSVG